jgi:thiol-disulfide isomerase/thioredoxin
VGDPVDHARRRLLGQVAMTMAAPFAMLGTTTASGRVTRELAAIDRAAQWLASPPLKAADLAGKVVLVDFWTYTCINWLRTLPYVRAWARKYKEHDLVVIGVHTPEFPFEQNVDNVRRAVERMRIDYPVVIDNDQAIWRAFRNQYWPALYFLDAGGQVRERQFGEGEYERAEQTIQRLLAAAGATSVPGGLVSVEAAGVEAAADWNTLRSPELYLGLDRTANFASPGGAASDSRRGYAAPTRLALNEWALAGQWTMSGRSVALAEARGRVVVRFHARDVHLVMGPARPGPQVPFRVTIDGQPPGPSHGADVDEQGHGVVAEPRLYQLIRQPGAIGDRTFEIEFLGAGVETWAFTFG